MGARGNGTGDAGAARSREAMKAASVTTPRFGGVFVQDGSGQTRALDYSEKLE